VLEVHRWAHTFVHTTYLYSSYLQFFALKVIEELFVIPKDGIKIYNGKYTRNSQFASIEIRRYKSLRRDFEQQLKKKIPGVSVQWMKYKDVGAYIISL
jgi:hypothetical protein